MKRTILIAVVLFLCVAPASAQQHDFDAEVWYLQTPDSVNHFVTEFGRGDTVVVLHGGWGAEHHYLIDAVRPLADLFHFVLYDQRGSLRSPAPDSTITIKQFVEDLEALRQELGLEQLTLLGHSMGSWLAYAYHAKYPQHVRGITVIGPVPPVVQRDIDSTLVAKMQAAYERLNEGQEARIAAEIAEEGLDCKSPSSDKERTYCWRIRFTGSSLYHVERWRQMEGGRIFYDAGVGDAIQQNTTYEERLALAREFLPALQKHPIPVRVIIGTHDFVDPGVIVWPHIIDKLPNAQLEVLERAGHSAWIDRLDAFTEALQDALQETT